MPPVNHGPTPCSHSALPLPLAPAAGEPECVGLGAAATSAAAPPSSRTARVTSVPASFDQPSGASGTRVDAVMAWAATPRGAHASPRAHTAGRPRDASEAELLAALSGITVPTRYCGRVAVGRSPPPPPPTARAPAPVAAPLSARPPPGQAGGVELGRGAGEDAQDKLWVAAELGPELAALREAEAALSAAMRAAQAAAHVPPPGTAWHGGDRSGALSRASSADSPRRLGGQPGAPEAWESEDEAEEAAWAAPLQLRPAQPTWAHVAARPGQPWARPAAPPGRALASPRSAPLPVARQTGAHVAPLSVDALSEPATAAGGPPPSHAEPAGAVGLPPRPPGVPRLALQRLHAEPPTAPAAPELGPGGSSTKDGGLAEAAVHSAWRSPAHAGAPLSARPVASSVAAAVHKMLHGWHTAREAAAGGGSAGSSTSAPGGPLLAGAQQGDGPRRPTALGPALHGPSSSVDEAGRRVTPIQQHSTDSFNTQHSTSVTVHAFSKEGVAAAMGVARGDRGRLAAAYSALLRRGEAAARPRLDAALLSAAQEAAARRARTGTGATTPVPAAGWTHPQRQPAGAAPALRASSASRLLPTSLSGSGAAWTSPRA